MIYHTKKVLFNIVKSISIRNCIYTVLFLIFVYAVSLFSYRMHIAYKIKHFINSYKAMPGSHKVIDGFSKNSTSTILSRITKYITDKTGVPLDKFNSHYYTRIGVDQNDEQVVHFLNELGSATSFDSVSVGGRIDAFGNRISSSLPEIHTDKLFISNAIIDENTFKNNVQFHKLKIYGCEITKAGFESIVEKYSSIQELDINNDVKFNMEIHRFKNLQRLSIMGDLDPLSSTNIRILSLRKTNLNKENCAAIRRLKNIKSVDLYDCSFNDKIVDCFCNLPQLDLISIYDGNLSEHLFCDIERLNLNYLWIESTDSFPFTMQLYIYLKEKVPEVDMLLYQDDEKCLRQESRISLSEASGFTHDCRVLTETGFKYIKDIKVGDVILCRANSLPACQCDADQKVVKRKVVLAEKPTFPYKSFPDHDLVFSVLTFETDKKSTPPPSLTTTPIQPLYVEGKGWVEAFEVEVGDRLRGKDGPTPVITEIKRVPRSRPMSSVSKGTSASSSHPPAQTSTSGLLESCSY